MRGSFRSTAIKHVLRVAVVVVLLAALFAGAVGSIRWAKRGGTAANLAASALLLTFGTGLVTTHPQRTIERQQEERDKSGGESGDPPPS